MKALQTIIAVATLLHAANTFAQTEEAEDATSYKAEVFGSASSGSRSWRSAAQETQSPATCCYPASAPSCFVTQ